MSTSVMKLKYLNNNCQFWKDLEKAPMDSLFY